MHKVPLDLRHTAPPIPRDASPLPGRALFLPAPSYDLSATLDSGQSFAWSLVHDAWEGVVQHHWVRLRQIPGGIEVTLAHPDATHPTPDPQPSPSATNRPPTACHWLIDYLQTEFPIDLALASFPPDEPLAAAVQSCAGLRILRQDPWECLASFLLSATKQIVQIQQIQNRLRQQYGTPVLVPPQHPPAFAFPAASVIAQLPESALRQCGMGFRAPYLREAAQRVARGELDLSALRQLPLHEARSRLLALPGVGPKIADCVLLFSADQPGAFPIDVWVARALRSLYFHGQPLPLRQLQTFACRHFGPRAGFAQQFLFHYARRHLRLSN